MNAEVTSRILIAINRRDLLPSYMRDKGAGDDTPVEIHDVMAKLKPEDIESCKNMCKEDYIARKRGAAARYTRWNNIIRYIKSGDDMEVCDLPELRDALKAYIEKTSPVRHWLFINTGDNQLVPIYVQNVELVRGRQDEPSHVLLTGRYSKRKACSLSVTFYREDVYTMADGATVEVANDDDDDDEDDEEEAEPKPKKAKSAKKRKGMKLQDVLEKRNLFCETTELFTDYKDAVVTWRKFQGKSGLQFSGTGTARYHSSNRWSYVFDDDPSLDVVKLKSLDRDTGPAALVLDDGAKPEKLSDGWGWYSDYWSGSSRDISVGMGMWATQPIVPIHPYLDFYDLESHEYLRAHVASVSLREFDNSMSNKLVLPAADRKFIDTIMGAANMRLEDIIRGKSGGVIVLSTGSPGTGKTLTAEVYAEQLQRPLYTVQCSQLGIKVDDIEKQLKNVLRRAERWNAILLLDEADVYVRARGNDIHHNAIVGVFLRVLEYFRGVLFMTSNKIGEEIDDAIISRCTAHLRYSVPNGTLLKEIWRVLSTQFEVALTEADIEKLCGKWPQLPGRSVKNLLKLARFSEASSKDKISADTIIAVSRYLDLSEVDARV